MIPKTLPPKYLNSSKAYECDGCMGEFMIPKDSLYARMAYRMKDGRIGTMKLCMRCICAYRNRVSNSGTDFEIFPGCFRFGRLSSRFRRLWTEYFGRIMELNSGDDGKGLTERLLDDIGITGSGKEAAKMEEQKKQNKRQRVLHREKAELKRNIRCMMETKKKLLAMLDRLACLHMKETVAWNRGDKHAVMEAKTVYGEYAEEIRRAINGIACED